MALVLVMSLVAIVIPRTNVGPAQSQAPATSRLAGDDRFATAAAIALAGFPNGTDTVLLARADAYADALSASALAGVSNAPLLLTGGSQPPAATMRAITELGADEVVLIGGTAAVPQTVSDVLAASGLAVSRVNGSDRYDTAATVAREVAGAQDLGLLDEMPTAFIASGENYPDALAAGGAAFAGPHPILLSGAQELPSSTTAALLDLRIEQVVLLGGTSALSASIDAQLDGLGISHRRLGGATRLETASLIADFSVEELGFGLDQVVLARGDDFPDALAAGPYAGATRSSIVLTGGPNLLGSPSASFFGVWCDIAPALVAVGSFGVMSDLVLAAASAALNCASPLAQAANQSAQLLDSGQRRFNQSTEGWIPQGNTTISQVDDQGRNDDTAMAILVDQAGPYSDSSRAARVGTLSGLEAIPVQPGATYRASWWIRPDSGSSPVRCELRWYDQGGDILDTTSGPMFQEELGTWTQARCRGVAPLAATYAGVRIFIADADYGDRHLVDDASLRLVEPAGDTEPPPVTPPPPPPVTPPPPPPVTPPPPPPVNPDGPSAYPDGPNDTGIAAAGLTREDLTPSDSITVNSGDVIDGLLVSGAITLAPGAQNVTIRNTLVEGTSAYGIRSQTDVRNLLIENVTIQGVSGSNRSAAILAHGQGVIRSVNVSGYPDGIKVFSNFVVEDSWIHDLLIIADSHNDGMQSVGGSGVTIRNNRIEGPYQTQTSALILQADNSPLSNYTITGNFLSGGTYTLYIRAKPGMPNPSNMTVTNNVWGGLTDDPSTENPANSWRFGTCSLERGSNWTVSGNVFQDGTPDPC